VTGTEIMLKVVGILKLSAFRMKNVSMELVMAIHRISVCCIGKDVTFHM
jgi:hypothetical protein